MVTKIISNLSILYHAIMDTCLETSSPTQIITRSRDEKLHFTKLIK